jgi:hypothetical protein
MLPDLSLLRKSNGNQSKRKRLPRLPLTRIASLIPFSSSRKTHSRMA